MLAAVALCFLAQDATDPPDKGPELEEVVAGLEALERNMVPFETLCHVEWHTLWGESFDPPLETEFLVQVDEHAVLVAIRHGVDPMDRYAFKHDLPYGPRVKLLRRGGEQEWYDPQDDKLTLRENPGMANPHESMTFLSPGPLAWSLGGSSRSRFVGVADWFSCDASAGETIEVLFGNEHAGMRTTNRLRFRKDWGWLASEAAILGRVEGELRPALEAVVHTVQPTRLGPVPRSAEYYGTQGFDSDGDPIPNVHFSIAFSEYRFAGVRVPGSLRSLDREDIEDLLGASDVGPQPGTLEGKHSAFTVTNTKSVESWYGRERQMDQLLAGHLGLDATSPGQARSTLLRLALQPLWLGAAAILLCAACWRRRPAARWLGGGLGLGVAIFAWSASRSVHAGELGPPTVGLEGEVSEVLCGVDAVYLATSMVNAARTEEPERADAAQRYTKILMISAPESQGTSLANLAITAKCLGYRSELINLDYYTRPPSPLIVHVDGNHFALCMETPTADHLVLVDPARGTFETEWERVRPMASPIALWIR
jgi:hypothetical protein